MDYIDFPERKVSIFEPDQNNYFFRSGNFIFHYESGAEVKKIAASLSSENNYTYIVAQLYGSYDRH